MILFQSYILGGLAVFTDYNVSVALSNVNGTGPFSDPITNVSCDGGETERETVASQTIVLRQNVFFLFFLFFFEVCACKFLSVSFFLNLSLSFSLSQLPLLQTSLN